MFNDLHQFIYHIIYIPTGLRDFVCTIGSFHQINLHQVHKYMVYLSLPVTLSSREKLKIAQQRFSYIRMMIRYPLRFVNT